ncbi:hypothetical protein GCM10010954_20730 [Halobacillus andaensis]|uniref:Uncharacterized protein n=1 Tax=Halobacillus andaensis TaxID=1176239 RepID=A0A917EVE2_HALAA|nr:hypothetical protein [Halobacillus andaensis]MBP2004420.1 hypothetical protein [Halobacillus andaensis]GGF21765.1 hypothetical protein GCM10010954_20730 [Halobacillus andaensis]
MFRLTAILFLLITVGCGQNLDENLEKSQGYTNRQDIMNMGLEDDPSTTPTNPRSIERVGDTWGEKENRDQIREAALTVEGVNVERIILEQDNAWVTVRVDEELTKEEHKQWSEKVAEKIRNAVPDYDVTVKVNAQ